MSVSFPPTSADSQVQEPPKRRRFCPKSFWGSLIHILGSLKFAVILLLTIATAIGAATLLESKFDSAVAQHYIYRNPLFLGWLTLLCINLVAATLTRWPWKQKHIGFVITHLGIILLLIGAVVGMLIGLEAFVTLHEKAGAKKYLATKQTVLMVQSAQDGGIDQIDFPLEVHPPRPDQPRLLKLPDSDLQLVVDDFSSQLVEKSELVEAAAVEFPAGVTLFFESARLGQSIALPLLLDREERDRPAQHDFFGMAQIEFYEQLPRKSLVAEKVAPIDFSQLDSQSIFRETHVVFADHPEAPIIQTELEQPSGYQVALQKKAEKEGEYDIVLQGPLGYEESWPLKEGLKRARYAAQGQLQVIVAEYWPDFVLKEGKPGTQSALPQNPVGLIHLLGKRQDSKGSLKLQVAPAYQKQGGEVLDFRLLKGNKLMAEGELHSGEAKALGWADWTVTFERLFSHGRMETTLSPLPLSQQGEGREASRRGIRAFLLGEDGEQGPSLWIAQGTSQLLTHQDHAVRVGLGLELVPLPFTIELEQFEVPRDEGTDTPSNFISSLKFQDSSTGKMYRDQAQMNHPAMYPGDWWRSFLGWNYKFSQAQWNPEDLKETTLQVLYDPGWPFKWTGSLLIGVGIFLLFYCRGKKKKR